MKKCILFLLLCALALPAADTYMVVQKTTLSSSSEAVTVQLAAGTTRTVAFRGASIYCSVACEITIERDGAAATATAITPAKLAATAPAAIARAYRSSDVGTGVTIGKQVVGAGATQVLDLGSKGLLAGENLTLRTDSISGTVIINIQWVE